jgi:hypothetical protein
MDFFAAWVAKKSQASKARRYPVEPVTLTVQQAAEKLPELA